MERLLTTYGNGTRWETLVHTHQKAVPSQTKTLQLVWMSVRPIHQAHNVINA